MDAVEDKISDSTRLLAKGTRITLKDGSHHNLIFDFEAIATLEEKYGSLEQFVAVLQDEKGKKFTAIRDAMTATLSHTDLSPEEIGKGLVFKYFQEYVDALTEALAEGMPVGLGRTPLVKKNLKNFRGKGFTGQRLSSSNGRTKNSRG
jgi:hypothetical protein